MMFSDLTQINVPYGLLDPGTQETLKAHGGPWEAYSSNGLWVNWPRPTWANSTVYRVKALPPAPPQPRTIYLCEEPGLIPTIHKTAIDATKAALAYGHGATVSEWREVL